MGGDDAEREAAWADYYKEYGEGEVPTEAPAAEVAVEETPAAPAE